MVQAYRFTRELCSTLAGERASVINADEPLRVVSVGPWLSLTVSAYACSPAHRRPR